MRSGALVLALAAASAAGQSTSRRPDTEDLNALSGTFVVVRFNRDGQDSGADELKQMRVEQEGGRWRFAVAGDVTTGEDRVHPGRRPRAVDSTYTNGPQKGATTHGIYEVDGAVVRYCHAEPGQPRPTDFTPGRGKTVVVLERVPLK